MHGGGVGGGGGGLAGVSAGVTVSRLQMSTQTCVHCERRRTLHVVNRIVSRPGIGRAGKLSTTPWQNLVALSSHFGPQLARQSASMSAVAGEPIDRRTSATTATSSAILGVVTPAAEAIDGEQTGVALQ